MQAAASSKPSRPSVRDSTQGVFVPCRVKMSDGRIEKIVLALRNDNPTGSWVADGGL